MIGLFEKDELPEECALRELKEETGYSGTVIPNMRYPILPVCCGTGSESMCLIPISVKII